MTSSPTNPLSHKEKLPLPALNGSLDHSLSPRFGILSQAIGQALQAARTGETGPRSVPATDLECQESNKQILSGVGDFRWRASNQWGSIPRV